MDPTAALQHNDHTKISVFILHQFQRPLGITPITSKAEQSSAVAYITYLNLILWKEMAQIFLRLIAPFPALIILDHNWHILN